MKYKSLLMVILLFAVGFNAHSQEECVTPNWNSDPIKTITTSSKSVSCGNTVRIKFYLLRDDNGENGIYEVYDPTVTSEEDFIAQNIALLNAGFAYSQYPDKVAEEAHSGNTYVDDIQFVSEGWEYLDNTSNVTGASPAVQELLNQVSSCSAINVYLGTPTCGSAAQFPTSEYKTTGIKIATCHILSGTLSHEVGHCFGLRHTFQNVATFHPVTGAAGGITGLGSGSDLYDLVPYQVGYENCESKDDHICDTYPQSRFASDFSCEYPSGNGYWKYMPLNLVDDIDLDSLENYSVFPYAWEEPNGNPFEFRQFDNFMGPSGPCRNKFTPGQSLSMKYHLENFGSLAMVTCAPETNLLAGQIIHTEMVIPPSTCGASNGVIGITAEDFTIAHLIDNVVQESAEDYLLIEGLSPGVYSFRATATCEVLFTDFTVEICECPSTNIVHSLTVTQPTDCNSADGAINIVAPAGYFISYFNGSVIEGPKESIFNIGLLAPGIYQFLVQGPLSCDSYLFNVQLNDDDCPPLNDECLGAIDIIPALFGVPAWETFTRESATQSQTGCVGKADDDIWFSFTAESSNDYILAQSTEGSFDAIIEVFDGCGGASLGCFNNYGIGEIERVIVGGLVVGQEYAYRVYSAAIGTPETINLRTQVKTFADGMVNNTYCGVLDYAADDNIVVEHQEGIQELYANPVINVQGYGVRFTDSASSAEEILDQTSGTDMFDFDLSNFSTLQEGVAYDVAARHILNLNANGMVSPYWSDWGSECVIGLLDDALTNDDCPGATEITPALFGVPAWETYPLYGATQSEPGCVGKADDDVWFKFTAQSSNDYILAQCTDLSYDAVIEVFESPSGPNICGITSLGCFNNYGVGAIERVIVGGLIPGQEYKYRVYSHENVTSPDNKVRTQVKTFADGMVASSYCGVLDYEMTDNILVERQEGGVYELYTNSAVNAKGYAVRFLDPVTNNVTSLSQITGSAKYDFDLSNVPSLQSGIAYDVATQHRLRLSANGTIDYYWSDWGTECIIGIDLGPKNNSTIPQLFKETELTLYPNPNSGEEFFVSLSSMVDGVQAVDLSLMDVNGRQLENKSYTLNGDETILRYAPTLDLVPGLYYIRVSSGALSNTFSVIIDN